MRAPSHARAAYCGSDQYTTVGTGEGFVVIAPRLYQPDGQTPAILYAHGAGGNGVGTAMSAEVSAQQYNFAHCLAEAGYLVVSGDWTGSWHWGNPGAMARMEAARAWVQDPAGLWRAKPGKVGCAGSSMGGVTSINFWRYNPANVAAVITTIPVGDLDDIRDYDRSSQGFRASINLAYGLPVNSTRTFPVTAGMPASSGQASLPATAGQANPATHLSELATMPYFCGAYSSDDPIISPPTVTTVANATLTRIARSCGALGHSEAAIGAMNIDDAITFMQGYLPLPTGEPY